MFIYMCNYIHMIVTTYLSQLFSKNKCDVLRYFYKYSKGAFTGRYISKELNMNHKTCLAVLNKLTELEILNKDVIGKSHVFSVNKSFYWENVIDPLILAELNLKQQICADVLKKYKEYCSDIIIFGSYATREETENSDLDICFVTNNKENLTQLLMSYQKHFHNYYLCHLSPYVITDEEYKEEKLTIIKEIKKYGESLYA